MKTVRFATKDQLLLIAEKARQHRLNRQASPGLKRFLDKQPEGTLYPIAMTIPHEHRAGQKCFLHWRCVFVLDSEGHTVTLDAVPEVFEDLKAAEVPDDAAQA